MAATGLCRLSDGSRVRIDCAAIPGSAGKRTLQNGNNQNDADKSIHYAGRLRFLDSTGYLASVVTSSQILETHSIDRHSKGGCVISPVWMQAIPVTEAGLPSSVAALLAVWVSVVTGTFRNSICIVRLGRYVERCKLLCKPAPVRAPDATSAWLDLP